MQTNVGYKIAHPVQHSTDVTTENLIRRGNKRENMCLSIFTLHDPLR